MAANQHECACPAGHTKFKLMTSLGQLSVLDCLHLPQARMQEQEQQQQTEEGQPLQGVSFNKEFRYQGSIRFCFWAPTKEPGEKSTRSFCRDTAIETAKAHDEWMRAHGRQAAYPW